MRTLEQRQVSVGTGLEEAVGYHFVVRLLVRGMMIAGPALRTHVVVERNNDCARLVRHQEVLASFLHQRGVM